MPFGPYQLCPGAAAPDYHFDFVQLLPTGSVLATSYQKCFILDPDIMGGYDHSNWRRIADIPYDAMYGTVSVLNSGKIAVYAGEYGSSLFNRDKVQIFDPTTETWTFIVPAFLSCHSSTNLTDDGRILGIPEEASLAQVGFNNRNSYMYPADGSFTNPVISSTFTWNRNESGLVTLPDGRFVNFDWGTFQGGKIIRTLRPINTAENVANGSFAGDGTVVSTDMSTTLNTFIDYRSRLACWTSVGIAITYEVGPAAWMPKIKKVVFVSGQGWILTYNPNTEVLEKPAELGMDPKSTDPLSSSIFLGTSVFSYQSAAQIVSNGTASTFQLRVNPLFNDIALGLNSGITNNNNKIVFIRVINNTQFVALSYTLATYDANTNICTLSGISLSKTQGSLLAPIVAGDEVCWGRPSYIVQDGAGTFLPNGDLFMIGMAEQLSAGNNFDGLGRYLKWDGVTQIATPVTNDVTSKAQALGFAIQLFNLPDGTIFCKESSNLNNFKFNRIYTPTPTEAIPFTGARPVVNYFPEIVMRNQICTLFGSQLNGLHEGGIYGDDGSPRSNFPIVRLKNRTNGFVYTCRTYDYTYRGIGENRVSQASVEISSNVPDGEYEMTTVAGGVASLPKIILVGAAMGDVTYVNSYR